METQQISIEDLLKDAEDVKCSCGNQYFLAATNLKKVSAIRSPTGKEEIAQLGVYICSKCGTKFEKPKIIT